LYEVQDDYEKTPAGSPAIFVMIEEEHKERSERGIGMRI